MGAVSLVIIVALLSRMSTSAGNYCSTFYRRDVFTYVYVSSSSFLCNINGPIQSSSSYKLSIQDLQGSGFRVWNSDFDTDTIKSKFTEQGDMDIKNGKAFGFYINAQTSPKRLRVTFAETNTSIGKLEFNGDDTGFGNSYYRVYIAPGDITVEQSSLSGLMYYFPIITVILGCIPCYMNRLIETPSLFLGLFMLPHLIFSAAVDMYTTGIVLVLVFSLIFAGVVSWFVNKKEWAAYVGAPLSFVLGILYLIGCGPLVFMPIIGFVSVAISGLSFVFCCRLFPFDKRTIRTLVGLSTFAFLSITSLNQLMYGGPVAVFSRFVTFSYPEAGLGQYLLGIFVGGPAIIGIIGAIHCSSSGVYRRKATHAFHMSQPQGPLGAGMLGNGPQQPIYYNPAQPIFPPGQQPQFQMQQYNPLPSQQTVPNPVQAEVLQGQPPAQLPKP